MLVVLASHLHLSYTILYKTLTIWSKKISSISQFLNFFLPFFLCMFCSTLLNYTWRTIFQSFHSYFSFSVFFPNKKEFIFFLYSNLPMAENSSSMIEYLRLHLLVLDTTIKKTFPKKKTWCYTTALYKWLLCFLSLFHQHHFISFFHCLFSFIFYLIFVKHFWSIILHDILWSKQRKIKGINYRWKEEAKRNTKKQSFTLGRVATKL